MESPNVARRAAAEPERELVGAERPRDRGASTSGATPPVARSIDASSAPRAGLDGDRGQPPSGDVTGRIGARAEREIPRLRVTPLPARGAAIEGSPAADALPHGAPRWQRAGRAPDIDAPEVSAAPNMPRGFEPASMPLVVAPRPSAVGAASGQPASEPATAAIAAGAPRPPVAAPKPEVDVDALVEKVQKKLLRRIAAERDRKGGLL